MRDQIPELEFISDRLIDAVVTAIRRGRRVSRRLPFSGRLLIDRPMPVLNVYRAPAGWEARADVGLVTAEASHLAASGQPHLHERTAELARAVLATLTERFGACLLIEVWPAAQRREVRGGDAYVLQPHFRVIAAASGPRADLVVDPLRRSLGHVRLDRPAEVVTSEGAPHPPGLAPLIDDEQAGALQCVRVGVEVEPVYRNPETGTLYPEVLRGLRRQFAGALKQTAFAFVGQRMGVRLPHPSALGPATFDKATRVADARLARVADAFDMLLEVTPTNEHEAWSAFQAAHFEREPTFHYRALPIDPATIKRELYRAPVQRVDDPTLANMLRERQLELDMEINLLGDRNRPRFVNESRQLFGEPDAELVALAESILARLPPGEPDLVGDRLVDSETFAGRARELAAFYREQDPAFRGSVKVRNDVSTLIVSQGCLLVDAHFRVRPHRVEALIHHEVSTHLLTYYNGRSQRLRQFHVGFAGTELLQEGLGVLAEHLVGGLDRERWRVLASRVVAVDCMVRGASFIETFRKLHDEVALEAHMAFIVTMRALRSGGFTKDLVYLKGIRDLLAYLADGGPLEPLYLGRFGLHHAPAIEELRMRGMIEGGWQLPALLREPGPSRQLDRVRAGLTVLDLVKQTER